MANITAEQAYEMMGKPKSDKIESLVLVAQKSYAEASDPLAKESALGLISRYFDILEWLDNKEILDEAKSIMAQVQKQVVKLKAMLLHNERVLISSTKTIAYQIIDSFGNAVQEMGDTSSLAIARQHGITEELLTAFNKNEVKAIAKLKEIANNMVNNKSRITELQSLALDISRVIPMTVNLAIVQGGATMKVETKSASSEYKNRLKAIRDGKSTTVTKRGKS